jgi:DNA-binding GntR family transcriptional regulator
VNPPIKATVENSASAVDSSEINQISVPIEERRRRKGIYADTCGRIRDMIVYGELASGDRINELSLCELLGVSRTPIREALKVLAGEGLIELLPNRGSRVSTPSSAEITNLFAIIAALERLAIESVAVIATEENLMYLRSLHDEMRLCHSAQDRERYFDLNHLIHETIINMACNPQLTRLHADLMTRARRPRFIAIANKARWEESVKEHDLLMGALELRDARFAGEILSRHVFKTGAAYLNSIETFTELTQNKSEKSKKIKKIKKY